MLNNDISANDIFNKLLRAKKLYAVISGNNFSVVREGTLHGFRFKRDDKVKDDSKRYYSFDLELYGDKEYLSRFDSSDINKTVFFTREEAEQKANSIRESIFIMANYENKYSKKSMVLEKLEEAKSQISLTGDDLEHYIDGLDTAIEIVRHCSFEEDYEKD